MDVWYYIWYLHLWITTAVSVKGRADLPHSIHNKQEEDEDKEIPHH